MKYRVLVQQDESGVFVVEVPSLPGCISQGATRSEAIENIKEAIQIYLESLEAHGDPVPPSISEDVVEVQRVSFLSCQAERSPGSSQSKDIYSIGSGAAISSFGAISRPFAD